MQLPKFSFSLPVYNEETRLESCINSILSQDYPRENIEILVVDGGSTDNTRDIASRFDCVRLFNNPRKLADYGAKISTTNSRGDLLVMFAADNELVGKDWLKIAASVFLKYPKINALWGRIVSSEQDPPLNKYYALIQNDPLSFFINRNIQHYLKNAKIEYINEKKVYIFNVSADKPLIWGANGLVYRTDAVRDIILQDRFVGDNDVFQTMIESGLNTVAYLPELAICHHHIKRINDWMKKWKRNFMVHLIENRASRNMNWIFEGNFKFRLFLWIIYSGIPVFSFMHSIYLLIKDRNIYWLYHPLVSFMQLITYSFLSIFTIKGRKFIKNTLFTG